MKSTGLFRRNFTIMVIGQIISLFGNSILRFALSLYVLDLTGSAAAFGGILAISMIPTVLLSPFGGVLADRVPRQKIMWGLDFLTAALIAGFTAALFFRQDLMLITIMMTALSVIQAFYQPSVSSSIPVLVDEEQLMAANGIVVQVQALSSLLGPILGGLLYGFLVPAYGLMPILTVSCACFLFSAVMELFLHIPFNKQEGGGGIRQVREDLSSAFRFLIRENKAVARLLIVIAGLNLFLAALFMVGLPYLIKIYLGLSAQMYGFAEAALGLGSIIGGISSGLIAKRVGLKKSYIFLLLCAVMLLPISVSLFLSAPAAVSYGIITGCVLIGMAATALFNIACQTYMQKSTPNTLLGKVNSFVTVICVCALPLGQALYGFLFEFFAALPWLPVLFGAVVSLALCLLTRRALAKIKE